MVWSAAMFNSGRLLFCGALVLSACREQSDVGEACPMELPTADDTASESSVAYPATVEINTEFPCDSLVCVAMSGRPAYCTSECRADASCPDAFECRVVNETGPFAGRKYCVWRRCRVQLECGDVSKYDCIEGYYGPEEPPGLCGQTSDEE